MVGLCCEIVGSVRTTPGPAELVAVVGLGTEPLLLYKKYKELHLNDAAPCFACAHLAVAQPFFVEEETAFGEDGADYRRRFSLR